MRNGAPLSVALKARELLGIYACHLVRVDAERCGEPDIGPLWIVFKQWHNSPQRILALFLPPLLRCLGGMVGYQCALLPMLSDWLTSRQAHRCNNQHT